MNMRALRKSRTLPTAGDVFVFQMPDSLFRYGRVIQTDTNIGGFKNSILIYIYRATSGNRKPIPQLTRDDLLIAPTGTDRCVWTRGYFENIENRLLTTDDVLPVHCFWSGVFDCYKDELGNRLSRRHEPCGLFGLGSEVTIDCQVSMALGFLLAPPNPKHLIGKPRRAYQERYGESLKRGMPPEQAEIEGLKEVVRYRGEHVADYAWPGIPNERSARRVRPIVYGPDRNR